MQAEDSNSTIITCETPHPYIYKYGYACYFCCMLSSPDAFAYKLHLVSMLFSTSIPTSFNILLKCFYILLYVLVKSPHGGMTQ